MTEGKLTCLLAADGSLVMRGTIGWTDMETRLPADALDYWAARSKELRAAKPENPSKAGQE